MFYEGFSFGGNFQLPSFGQANALLTFTQCLLFNIVVIILERLKSVKESHTSFLIDLVVLGLFYLLNWHRYSRVRTIEQLENKWAGESKTSNLVGSLLTIIYIFGTMATILYLTGFFDR